MHENANIAFENAETSSIINTIVALEPRDAAAAASGGLTNDQIVAQMAQSFLVG